MKTTTLVIKNKTLKLEFCRETGALVGMTAVKTGWKILDRPHLGLSFRLLLPLSEEKRNNNVNGEGQKLTSLKTSRNGKSVIFIWDGVTSEFGGAHDIRLTLKVTLTERQAVYAMTVRNRSGLVVENVFCPYLGDLRHPAGDTEFKAISGGYSGPSQRPLWPTFRNMKGYFGVDYPTQIGGNGFNPQAPFVLSQGTQEGLYAGVCAETSELVAWHAELRPGFANSINSQYPLEDSIAGKDVQTRFAAVHLPIILDGETRDLTPIALEAYQGGWQAGADIYKAWRSTWMKTPRLPTWARHPHAWQQLHINSPEDELRIRFKDLVKIGEDCARHGVKAIQLVGWNDGGQDQGNPSHDPDPRLGTWDELKEAIARIQALGVKMILFAKFTWADRATEWFRKDLIKLSIKDPYGDYYMHSGYQYQTVTQLLDINTKRLIPLCFLSERYQRLCEKEFKKMVDLGADGILYDESQHHGPALLCFDKHHGHRPGAPVYSNDRKLVENFRRISDPVNPEFLFAGEACYDWEMQQYHLSYFRTEDKGHIPFGRYLLPQALFMTAVTGFEDRSMVNQCLLCRYVISYEPYNFKGRLDDYPATINYGKMMDALRTELREYFWDGEYRDTVGADMLCESKENQRYSVFVSRKTGKMGVVVVNYDTKKTVTVKVKLAHGQALTRYRLVDDPEWKSARRGIVIPPDSAAVVLE